MDVSYERIKGSIGSLLLVWGKIERSARDEVVSFHGCLPKSAHGIAAVLRTWENTVIEGHPATSLCPLLAATLRAELQRPLDIRNGICHGLVGISEESEDMRASLQWEINDEKHSISWEDLQASLSWLSKICFAFSIISNASLEETGSRAINNDINREWWLTEFGLNLLTE
jgi:hypothetical protein